MRRLLLLAALCLLTSPAHTQPGFAGYQDFSFTNTTGQGSAQLLARVYYPSTSPGLNAPLLARPGGYPVVVFLHGLGVLGSSYFNLGECLVQRGYIGVLSDTAQFSASVQVNDGRALFPALVAANAQSGHFLAGALDMSRAGLSGHSMGGGSTFNVLSSNPGYVAGLAFATVHPGAAAMNAVGVPFGVLHGQGDTITPWQTTGLPVYTSAGNYQNVKFFYLFDQSCTHTNLVGFPESIPGREVWARARRVMIGFFDRFLSQVPAGLEEVVGPTARAEPHLADLQVEVELPELWIDAPATIGRATRFEALCEPGPAAILVAAGTTAIPTPFGVLRLEPATLVTAWGGTTGVERLLTGMLPVPNDPTLVGVQLPFQGIGLTNAGLLELTDLLMLAIGL